MGALSKVTRLQGDIIKEREVVGFETYSVIVVDEV